MMRLDIVKQIAGRMGILLLAIAMLAALAACSDDESDAPAPEPAAQETPAAQAQAQAAAEPAAPGEPIRVVATTSIVADWVANVGGDHVDVFSLVPLGADPHSFQPGAQDVAKVADAHLILSIGLSLEEAWLLDLIENAAPDPNAIVALGELIEPIEFVDTHAGEEALIEGIDHVVHEFEEGEIDAATGLAEISHLLEAMEDDHAHEEDDHADDEDDHGHDEDDHADDEDDHGHDEDDHAEEEGDHADDEDDHAHEEDDHADDEDDHAHEEDAHGHGEELSEMVSEIIAAVEAGEMSAEEAMEEIEHLIHELGDMTHEGEDMHEGHGHGLYDPHFWFDPIRVQVVISDIAERLAALDPDRADDYRANADAYNAQLDELHAWTEEQVSALPMERRLLVTSHDSLGYFAARYGFEVVGTVIPSFSTDVEPTPEDLIELTEEILKYDVPAVFGETTVSERLARSIATETGAALVQLYSGSLGAEGSGGETYIGMVRSNVERIVEALG